jgi:hypothetical protein
LRLPVARKLERVARDLKVKRRFTTAYAPWAIGTVEVICRSVIQALRKLCREFVTAFSQLPDVLHIAQIVLNSSASKKLVGRPPLNTFTLPDDNPVLSLMPRKDVASRTIGLVRAEQLLNVEQLQEAVESMHMKVSKTADRLIEKAVRAHNVRCNVHPVNFEVGDFVLVGTVQRNKMQKLVWLRGPVHSEQFDLSALKS